MTRRRDESLFPKLLAGGVVAGLVFWLARPARASTAWIPPTPRAPQGRISSFPSLVERWRGPVSARAGDLPVDAILEWIRIESGGDMCAVGSPTEVGIFQLQFPGDSKFGATLEGLKALCDKSKTQNPTDLSWMSLDDLDVQVGSGIRKIAAARNDVRRVLAQSGVHWPETSFDFGSAVKQIHAAPAVITELLPKIARQGTPPASWGDLRERAATFPVDQMGPGLRRLWQAQSRRGLRNRLEDTMRNAEFVGRAWAGSYA